MPSRTINIESSTDLVGVEIDEHGQIVWDDELKTAYEYEVAFEAMGGDKSQLTRFMGSWTNKKRGPVSTLLLLLKTPGQVIDAAADALASVVVAMSGDHKWSEGFHEREAIVAAINVAHRFELGSLTYDDLDVAIQDVADAKKSRYSSLPALNATSAAGLLLNAVFGARDLEPIIKEVKDVFAFSSAAMGYVLSGKDFATILETAWFEAEQQWEGCQVARLAELVHASQLGYRSWAEIAWHSWLKI